MRLTVAGTVVIGAGTYAIVRESVVARPLGSPELKGKSRRVQVYELLAMRDGVAGGMDVEVAAT